MTISRTYYSYSIPEQKDCYFCLESIEPKETAYAHTGEGDKHPIHETCFQSIKILSNCPMCRVPISNLSILIHDKEEPLPRAPQRRNIRPFSVIAIVISLGIIGLVWKNTFTSPV